MTLLHVICGLGLPPIKNLGYAYGCKQIIVTEPRLFGYTCFPIVSYWCNNQSFLVYVVKNDPNYNENNIGNLKYGQLRFDFWSRQTKDY